MMKSLSVALLLSSLATGCVVDESSPDAPSPRPPHEVHVPDELLVETPTLVGFANATAVERKRILEAALGVDADRAMIETDSIRGGTCPSEEPIEGGVILHGGCSDGSLRVAGTATITTASNGDRTYVFDHFELTLDGRHDTYDGLARFDQLAPNRLIVHAESLLVSRSDDPGDEADHVITSSTGTWANTGDGKVVAQSYSFPAHPELQVWVGANGVGRYAVTSSFTLETERGWVSFKGAPGFSASTDGGGCWTYDVHGATLEPACGLASLILLNPAP